MEDQFDPREKLELALLRAEHQKRFQLQMAYVKERVGQGIEYRNDVARIVVSDSGAYYELLDLPEEFAGAAGDQVERHFVSPAEAISLLGRVFEAAQGWRAGDIRALSIFVLYARRGLVDRKSCYVFDYRQSPGGDPQPCVIGRYRSSVMPLFFKVRVDADWAADVLGMPGGMVFCMANAGERNLLIRIPLAGCSVDLIAEPGPIIVQ